MSMGSSQVVIFLPQRGNSDRLGNVDFRSSKQMCWTKVFILGANIGMVLEARMMGAMWWTFHHG